MVRNQANLSEWNRAYYEKRKNEPGYKRKKKKSAQRYYLRNKAKIDARHKKYHQENIEAYRQYRRDYRVLNPRGIFSALKDGAKKRGKSVEFSIDDFVQWWESQEQSCFYCNRTMEQIRQQSDVINSRARRFTIDRADNSISYTLPNIRLACYRCNSVKADYFTEAEMLQIGRIISVKSN